MTKVAILQSNYIPWKGYFDLINSVDHFVLYDDMQYTRRDWRNRNQIQTKDGLQWLTIPVDVSGKYFQKINETVVADSSWREKHWKTLCHTYSKAQYFDEYKNLFEKLYLASDEKYLSQINYSFLKNINTIFDIQTQMHWSSDFSLIDGKSERLLGLCKDLGATSYLSGPAAKDYLDEPLFKENGVDVLWMDYRGYPEYQQLHKPFQHGVTVLDLIFNEGPNAPNMMKSFRKP